MKKQYIAPQMVETEITLRSCICSGGNTPKENPVDPEFQAAPTRKLGTLYI